MDGHHHDVAQGVQDQALSDCCEQDEIEIGWSETDFSCQRNASEGSNSSPSTTWSLPRWVFNCLEGPLVPAAATETDAAATRTTANNNKRQTKKKKHRAEVLVAILLLTFFAIAIGTLIGLRVTASRRNRAGAVSPLHQAATSVEADAPTAGAASTIGGMPQTHEPPPSREDLAVCDNAIPHPPLPGKRGSAFTLRDEGQNGSWVENLPKVVKLKPYWNYSWGTKRIAQQPNDIEFIPMLWTGNNPAGLQSAIVNHLLPQIQSGHAKRLLGFNEPDNPTQANMLVETALSVWPQLEQTNLPLISPSCWHPERDWMKQFAKSVDDNCMRMEWVGVHWYGGASFIEFQQKMQEFYNLYQRPLLVTEFAPADWSATTVMENKWTEAMVLDFMKQALPWLEATPWIAGYCWFSFSLSSPAGTSSALIDAQGDLTTNGRYYASVTTADPDGDLRIGTDQDPINDPIDDDDDPPDWNVWSFILSLFTLCMT